MITKKCATSFGVFALSVVIVAVATEIMSFFTLSKWVGVSVGGGLFAVMLILCIIFRKVKGVGVCAIPVNAMAGGIAVSSYYVHIGGFPRLWEIAVAVAVLLLMFLIYCLLTNVAFFRNHFVLCIFLYICVILAAGIVGAVLTDSKIFTFALFCSIPFTAFIVSLAIGAKDGAEHFKNLTVCSFAALILVIIAVLAVISEGDGLDGIGDAFTGGTGSGKGGVQKRNPYDYLAVAFKTDPPPAI